MKRNSMDNDQSIWEMAVRKAAAMILVETTGRSKITLKKVAVFAKKLGVNVSDLLSELEERFYRVGLILKKILPEGTADESNAELFVVVDPKLDVGGSKLDSISSAILAAIYVRFGRREAYIRDIVELVTEIVGSHEKANSVVSKAIRILENEKLIVVNPDKGSLKLSSRALALLPDKRDIEELLIDLLAKKSEKK